MKKIRKRIKLNWFHIIEQFGLLDEYNRYKTRSSFERKRKHKRDISDNRIARAFVLTFNYALPKDLSWAIKGKELDASDDIKAGFIIKAVKWC